MTHALILSVDMQNFSDVYLRIKSSISNQYFDFGIVLGISPEDLSNIRIEPKTALSNVLQAWLKQNYNAEKHGLPTWRKLVEAVDHPAGGNNHALAKAIASEHPKKLQQGILCSLLVLFSTSIYSCNNSKPALTWYCTVF